MTAPTGSRSVRQQLIDQSRTDDPDSVIGDRWPVSGLLSTSPLRDVEVPADISSFIVWFPAAVGTSITTGPAISVDAINIFRVSAGRFASFFTLFRVVKSGVFPVHTAFWAWFEIPGSSTEKKLVKAKSLGQHSFSSTRHQHQSSKLTSWRRFGLVRVKTAALKVPSVPPRVPYRMLADHVGVE